jgi:hypothetical protein
MAISTYRSVRADVHCRCYQAVVQLHPCTNVQSPVSSTVLRCLPCAIAAAVGGVCRVHQQRVAARGREPLRAHERRHHGSVGGTRTTRLCNKAVFASVDTRARHHVMVALMS